MEHAVAVIGLFNSERLSQKMFRVFVVALVPGHRGKRNVSYAKSWVQFNRTPKSIHGFFGLAKFPGQPSEAT